MQVDLTQLLELDRRLRRAALNLKILAILIFALSSLLLLGALVAAG